MHTLNASFFCLKTFDLNAVLTKLDVKKAFDTILLHELEKNDHCIFLSSPWGGERYIEES